jgi:hypothetical protein
VFERAALDGELAEIEVATVAQHRERDATETMGDGDHGQLVAAPRAERREVRVERMGGAAVCAASQNIARSSAAPRFVMRP